MILITLVYGLGFILLRKFPIISMIYSIIGALAIIFVLFIEINKIFLNRMPKKYLNKKDKFNMFKNISNSLKYMKNNDLKVLKNILIKNKLYRVSIIDEMLNYYKLNLNKENFGFGKITKEILGLFLTIIFGIIGVYTSIKLNLSIDEMINSILNITLKVFFIFSLTLIVYFIYKFNKFSILHFYVYNRLYKLLIEIKISKLIKYNKKIYK